MNKLQYIAVALVILASLVNTLLEPIRGIHPIEAWLLYFQGYVVTIGVLCQLIYVLKYQGIIKYSRENMSFYFFWSIVLLSFGVLIGSHFGFILDGLNSLWKCTLVGVVFIALIEASNRRNKRSEKKEQERYRNPSEFVDDEIERGWIEYVMTFAISLIIICILYFNCLDTYNSENDRYLLSALLQSEAAILAIVVSLSLIAVQLTASSYSPRVVELFKGWENLDLWFLVMVYTFTMGLTALTLKNIGNNNLNWKVYTTASIFLAIWCFISLVPYTRRLLDFLKPSTSIKKFAKRIDKTSLIRAFTETDKTKIGEIDPIQPIVDIAYNALQKRDLETVRNSLKAIVSRTIAIFDDNFFDSEIKDGDKILTEVVAHLLNIGKFSIKLDDWDSVRYVINAITRIGTKTAEIGFFSSTSTALWTLREFIQKAVERNINTICEIIVSSIGEIGKFAAKSGQILLIQRVLRDLELQSSIFINSGNKNTTDHIAIKIKEIYENIEKVNKPAKDNLKQQALAVLKAMKQLAQQRNFDISIISWCIDEIEN